MKITIQYDLRLYSRSCLEQTIIAYSDFIENVVKYEEVNFEVTFSNEAKNEEELMHLVGEFNNYILHLENHKGA